MQSSHRKSSVREVGERREVGKQEPTTSVQTKVESRKMGKAVLGEDGEVQPCSLGHLARSG